MAAQSKNRRLFLVLGGTVLLVGLGAIGLARLDSYLLATAREHADEYGRKLGRPVRLDQISTTLLTGAGVRIEGLEVGPAAGEVEPLLRLSRFEVKVALLPILFSWGREIPIRSAEATGLAVNVVRGPDGTTNIEAVAERLGSQAGPRPTDAPQPPRDLSAVRVDHLALHNAEVHLVDRSRSSSGRVPSTLAVTQIEFLVDDLRVGKSLDVVLKAAVLAPSQNLEVKLATAPLPPSLVPTPEHVVLKLQPLDVTPLAPFLPKSVHLRGGQLDADLTADLGALASGGKGATKLVGQVHGRNLRAAESEGGKALDASLEANVTGDVERGDLALDTLKLVLGPAELNGHGAIRQLLSDHPEMKGLEVTGRNLDPELLAPYYPPLRDKLHGTSGPLGLTVKASGNTETPSLAVLLDFGAMRVVLSNQMSKAAGVPMALQALLSGAAKETLRFDVRADLKGVDLRPGGQLDKAPGQPLAFHAVGSYQAIRGKTRGMKVEVSSLELEALGDSLSGSGRYETAGESTQFSLTFNAPHLDADALLKPTGAGAATEIRHDGGDRSPGPAHPVDPHRFDGYRGEVKALVGSLRYQETNFRNVKLALRMTGDLLAVEQMEAGVHEGEVNLDGSQLRLAPRERPFDLKLKASGIDVAALLPRSVPHNLLSGRFNGSVAVSGAGSDQKALARTLTGLVRGTLIDGTFLGADVVSLVAGPLARALPFGAVGLKDGQSTSLGHELPIGIQFAEGVARLTKPLRIVQERASLTLDEGGGIGLDGKLGLTGVLALQPETVKQMTKGKVTLRDPLPVGFKVGGLAWDPQITNVDLRPAVQTIVQQATREGLEGVLGGLGGAGNEDTEARRRLQEKAKEKLRGLFGR